MRVVIKLSVQLPHGDRLGVEVKRLHLLVTLAFHTQALPSSETEMCGN